MPIRVLLVDDRPSVRRGLKMSLALEADIAVVGEAGDGEEALRQAAALKPDIVVMDVEMRGMGGLDATSRIRRALPGTAVVILTFHDSEAVRQQARVAGAVAFVAKHEGLSSLTRAIRGASQRGECCP